MPLENKYGLFHGYLALSGRLVRLSIKLSIVRFVFLQNVVNGSQEHSGDSDNRFLVSAPLFDSIVAVSDFGVSFAADSAKRALNKQRFDVNPCAGNAGSFYLAGAIIVLRSKACPRTKIS